MTLCPREVGLLGIMKGVSEAANRLQLPEEYVKDCALQIDEDPFFQKIRENIIEFIRSHNVIEASHKFHLPSPILNAMVLYDEEIAKGKYIVEAY